MIISEHTLGELIEFVDKIALPGGFCHDSKDPAQLFFGRDEGWVTSGNCFVHATCVAAGVEVVFPDQPKALYRGRFQKDAHASFPDHVGLLLPVIQDDGIETVKVIDVIDPQEATEKCFRIRSLEDDKNFTGTPEAMEGLISETSIISPHNGLPIRIAPFVLGLEGYCSNFDNISPNTIFAVEEWPDFVDSFALFSKEREASYLSGC